MSTTSVTLIFVAWMLANFLLYAIVLFSFRPRLVGWAEVFLRASQWLLGAVFIATIAEVWWQESLLHFSASPTGVLTVPIQDHGTKYVSRGDARIIHFFNTVFFLMFLPFLAAAVGETGQRSILGDRKNKDVSQ